MGMTKKYPRTRCIGIDIDGTLLKNGGLNRSIADWAGEKKADGWDVILWSARGRAYAEAVAERFGIADNFTAIIGKPGYIVDDLGWGWVKFTSIVKKLF